MHGIIYSPLTIGKAPIKEFNFEISSFGPANSEVPVSAIAWQPPLQNDDPLTETLKKKEIIFFI